jgi:DNA invertase Pin-like site-specific DNA recombinase
MTTNQRGIAIYVRVSSRQQDTRSQKPELERWVQAFAGEAPVRWFEDRFTGRTMDRPGWRQLEQELHAGTIDRLVIWRIDRLGRTAAGLTKLFDELGRLRVNLISLKDGLDLSTPAGRLLANLLASVAQFETEIRAERVRAGQQAARTAGKTWGGSKKGRRIKVPNEQAQQVRRLHAEGTAIASIARAVSLSRPTVYALLQG